MDRRRFLRLFAGAAAFGVAGCTCRPHEGLGELVSSRLPSEPGVSPFGLPTGSDSPGLIIDAHVHIFNGGDLAADGYWKGPIVNEFGGGALGAFLRALTPVIRTLTRFAPSVRKEMEMLTSFHSDPTLSAATAFARLKTEQVKAISDKLYKTIPGKAWREYEAFVEDTLGPGSISAYGNPVGNRSGRNRIDRRKFIDHIVQSYYFGDQATAFDAQIDSVETKLEAAEGVSGGGFLTFIVAFMSYRSVNLQTYLSGFNSAGNQHKVDACVASLVDFDYWLGKCENPYSSLHDQVELLSKIAVLFDGAVLPVVAYNPWPESEDSPSSLALVEKAITERGFVGVKLYPGIGYRPIGNESAQYDPKDKAPKDAEAVNTMLKQLYAKCMGWEVPVMAHSNFSMAEFPAYKAFAGPDAWAKLLTDPAYSKLRVQFGHFGGASGKTEAGDNWTEGFVKLMQGAHSQHVYGDISYWNELYSEKKKEKARCQATRMALKQAGATRIKGQTLGIDRILYGSDWLMLTREKGWKRYLDKVVASLSQTPPPDSVCDTVVGWSDAERAKVMGLNAVSLYGLGKGQANRKRLDAFYGKTVTPAWRSKVDAL